MPFPILEFSRRRSAKRSAITRGVATPAQGRLALGTCRVFSPCSGARLTLGARRLGKRSLFKAKRRGGEAGLGIRKPRSLQAQTSGHGSRIRPTSTGGGGNRDRNRLESSAASPKGFSADLVAKRTAFVMKKVGRQKPRSNAGPECYAS